MVTALGKLKPVRIRFVHRKKADLPIVSAAGKLTLFRLVKLSKEKLPMVSIFAPLTDSRDVK